MPGDGLGYEGGGPYVGVGAGYEGGGPEGPGIGEGKGTGGLLYW